MKSKLIVRDGTSQDDRLQYALRQGYVNVDEMRFEDLLAMASEYAGLLEYRDANNRPAGNWKAFFEADEACILASLLATNLSLIEAGFLKALAEGNAMSLLLREGKADARMLAALGLARKIDSWHRQLGALSSVAAVRAYEKIADIVENSLKGELHKLHMFLRQHGVDESATVISGLGSIWHGLEIPVDAPKDPRQFLKSNFYSFLNAVLFLQEWAGDTLSLSLERSNHDPSMGLYFAFLRLFGKVQGKINDFTQRHLNFYYEDVLKVHRRECAPDGVHLVFSPDSAGREVLIAKGTEFRAGLDENNEELIYRADNDLLVTDARVHSLHTLYFGRNRLSFPENALAAVAGPDGEPRTFATSAKLNRITGAPTANDRMKAHPLFGSYQRSKAQSLFEEAGIGFAVASNVLLMKQGRRDVTLTLKFESHSEEDSLDAFTARLGSILETSPQDAFFKAFRNMFRISLSGEHGWLDMEEYLPLSHVVDAEECESDCLKIRMHLPDSAGAVVPYAREVHGEDFDTDQPVARFHLNPDAYLYPYSLLRKLVIREVAIEVDVRGCTDVMIYNQQGQLSANAQFNPFGALPALGDYFIIGNYEAARKKLVTFEVEVEWGGLPQEMNGFEEYYSAYSKPFGNSVFKANLSVLRDRKWIPSVESEQPETDLFESGGSGDGSEDNRVEKKRRISFRGLCKFSRPLENVPEERYGYDAMTKDGFFRLTLGNPPYAFGHKEYPLVLSKTMTENARRSRFGIFKLFGKSRPPLPLPGQPYTPLVNAVSVNYRAVSGINLESVASGEEEQLREKIFHLQPLGQEALSPQAYGKIHLVPQYEADGNLFIGISASRLSGMLTLFFHLREDSLPEAGAMTFNFSWHYLAGNTWKRLEKARVVSDTTSGFLSSGIVTLDIPADIERGSTVLPGDLYWLRVSADGSHIHTLCSLYEVHAQVLKASWERSAGNSYAHLAARLPAGTIKEAKFSITGIQEIRQIMDSFGGAPPESGMQRVVRVSERLRHKNRAVTPWDYERLILQRFPEIYKVKCFPCMSGNAEHRGQVKPGQLLIVLIPQLKEAASANMQPMVNALLLREVREYVAGLSSAFTEIQVRNPAYERIQVRCKVRLRKGVSRGLQHNELNQEIVNYLSPWNPLGLKARFGWHIRCNDIQSHIQELDYIEAVSGLSMLHIMEEDSHLHRLADTARKVGEGKTLTEVRPAYPWSIAVPSRQHLIEIVDDKRAWQAEETGIARLSIGNTFILSRGKQ